MLRRCSQVTSSHWSWKLTCCVFKCRLCAKFGESALRSLIRFYPSILPSDVMQLCHRHPAQFLAYLDSLVKSRPEDQRWEGENICRLPFALIGHCFPRGSRCNVFIANCHRAEAPTMEEDDCSHYPSVTAHSMHRKCAHSTLLPPHPPPQDSEVISVKSLLQGTPGWLSR